jgi:hypothetical protein
MHVYRVIPREQVIQLQRALQRWENEGGAGLRDMQTSRIETGRSSHASWRETALPDRSSLHTAHENGSNR